MTYLFSNPQIKKWKTLFFLSFFLNIILVLTLFLREDEIENTTNEEEVSVVQHQNVPNAFEKTEINTEKTILTPNTNVPGEPIKSSVIIEENFFSAFNNSDDVARIASETGISNLSDLLSAHIGRLLMWDLVLRNDVRKKDRLNFIFRVIPDTERSTRKDMPDIIEIISVAYDSRKFNKTIKIYLFTPENSKFGKYYYSDGTMIEKIISPFAPIKEYFQVTSLLADRAPKHEGIDYKAVVGTPVYSTVEGTVSRKNWKTKYNGYCIEIEEKSKPFVFKYLHLSETIVDVGQKVMPGDHIANSGNTGKTTAPHLHYQINVGQKGSAVDPFVHHKTVIEKLSENDENKFRKFVVETDSSFH